MVQTVLSVPDISCEHCARTVTNALSPLAGVERVAVDIPAKQVTVEYDPARVDVAKMSVVLAEVDYPVATA
ncbi:MAG: copper chaperone [Thermomicrobiales bacterium]|jgi:copper chaperone CopZ|nr:copper chaperone [Thermomicrobiales bacterium]